MKKLLSILFLSWLLLASGCGNQGSLSDGAAGTGTVSKADIAATEKEKLVITWYYFPVFAESGDRLIDGSYEKYLAVNFTRLHPEIEVELEPVDFESGPEKLRLAIERQEADVVFDAPGRLVAYGKAGKLEELNEWFDDKFLTDVDNAALVKACSYKGWYYMYPLSSSPFYMAFNKERLEAAGALGLVREGWTTDEFLQVLQKLHQAGYMGGSVFCRGTGGDQGTRAFVCNLFGAELISSDLSAYRLNSEPGIQGLALVKQLVDKGWMTDGSFFNGSDEINNFVNGKTSFTILWGGAQLKAKENLLSANNIHIIEVPFPTPKGEPKLEYLLNGFAVVKNKQAQKVAASKLFVKYLCDDKEIGRLNVMQSGGQPVRKSFSDINKTAELQKLNRWTRYYSVYYNTVDGFSTMRSAWIDMLQAILKGTVDPVQGAANFVREADASLQKAVDHP